MTHKIKALYDEGKGMSIRGIAAELEISRNTVRKYLAMSEEKISERIKNPKRDRELDEYLDFLSHLPRKFPRLSSVKARRKLEEVGFKVAAKGRTFRHYVRELKKGLALKQNRYYGPVLDMIPGEQAQADAGCFATHVNWKFL